MTQASQGVAHGTFSPSLQFPRDKPRLSVALGIIFMIGSWVAAGCLFPSMGALAFAIGATGTLLSILSLLARVYCCPRNSRTLSSFHRKQPPKQIPRKDLFPDLTDLTKKEPGKNLPPLPRITEESVPSSSILLENIPFEIYALQGALLNLSLSEWLLPNRHEKYASILAGKEWQITLYDARIEALDKALQLKERMSRLIHCSLKVYDIIHRWPNSLKLKYALYMDEQIIEEFRERTGKEGNEENRAIWEALGARLLVMAQKGVTGHYLVDLTRIKASEITEESDPLAFVLMDAEELQKVNPYLLTYEAMQLLLDAPLMLEGKPCYRGWALTVAQLNANFGNFFTNYDFYKNLSKSQIQACLVQAQDKENPDRLGLSLLPLAENIDKLELTDEQWNEIGERNALALDITKVPEDKRKRVTEIVYAVSKGYLSLLSVPSFHTLMPYLIDEQWKNVGEANACALDINSIPLEKRHEIVSYVYELGSDLDPRQGDKVLPQLELPQATELWPYFSKEQKDKVQLSIRLKIEGDSTQ